MTYNNNKSDLFSSESFPYKHNHKNTKHYCSHHIPTPWPNIKSFNKSSFNKNFFMFISYIKHKLWFMFDIKSYLKKSFVNWQFHLIIYIIIINNLSRRYQKTLFKYFFKPKKHLKHIMSYRQSEKCFNCFWYQITKSNLLIQISSRNS